MINWFTQCSFDRPFEDSEPIGDCAASYPSFNGPLRYIHGLPIKCYKGISSIIIALLFTSGPANIARFIIAIIIDTFNCMFFSWAWPYAIKKCHKIILPFGAHCYSSSPIMFKTRVFWISASLYNPTPYGVLGTLRHTMMKISMNSHFLSQTPTTPGFVASKTIGVDYYRVPTRTQTFPLGSFGLGIRGLFDYGKTAKGLVGKIDEFHRTLLTKVSDIKRSAGRLCQCSFSGATLSSN